VAALKDLHKGERAFIVGTGPSLRISDLDRLKGELTFACNKIYLAFGETEWRPTYYSVVDMVLAEHNRDAIGQLDLCMILGRDVRPFLRGTAGVTYVRGRRNPLRDGEPDPGFSDNLLLGAYGGATVIYFQLQLAYYMGIREIYLIGLDFSFSVPEPKGETTRYGEVVLESSGEANHFHADYRKPGEKWTYPRLDHQYRAFLRAKEALESAGGFIANASRQTALDVFPRVGFDDLLPR
jgi:hypothetical protein